MNFHDWNRQQRDREATALTGCTVALIAGSIIAAASLLLWIFR